MTGELAIFFISIGAFAIGAHHWQKGNHLLRNGKKTRAIIFKNNCESNESDGIYYPVVRFLTDKQEWITQELSIGYNPAKEEGTKLEVIYDPDDPNSVEISSGIQLKILPRILVIAGILGLILVVLELFNLTQLINE